MALLNITDPTIRQPPPGQVRPYPSPTSTGKIPFHIKSHNIAAETWYALYGTLDDDDDDDDDTTTTPAANGRAPPLIVLHGGPGATHHYLKPLALLSQGGPHGAAGRPVLLYDQIGCGHSTRLRAHRGDNTLWQPQLFLDELTNLVTHLGLRQFDLLGQSWGGMLVAQYAAMARPPGLRRLVLANCPADMDTWVAVANELGGLLPEETQRTLRRLEEEEREGEGEKGSCGIASEEYEKAMLPFYQWFVCRLEPMAPEFVETMKNLKEDDTAYHTMIGPSEFHVTGNLKTWDIRPQLGKIQVPTLLINGHFDEAQDAVMEAYFQGIKGPVKWVRFAESSHVPQLEETEAYLLAVGQFLAAGEDN